MTPECLALLARADLSPAARVVAIALAARFGAGQAVHLGMALLCQLTGLPDRTARRALREAIDAGAIELLRAPGHGAPPLVAVLPPLDAAAARLAAAAAGPAARMAAANDAAAPAVAAAAARMTVAAADPAAPSSTLSKESSEGGERKEGGAGGRKRAVPTTLPPGFSPSDRLLAHVRRHCPLVDLSRELSAFVLYWREGKGAGKLKSDWQGAFRVWCEKAQDWAQDRRLPVGGAAAPGGARAASPPPASRPESEGMRRLREMAEEARRRRTA